MKLEMQREQSRRRSDCGADVTSIPAGHMKTDPFCKAVCFGQTMFDILVPAPILSEYSKICHIYNYQHLVLAPGSSSPSGPIRTDII